MNVTKCCPYTHDENCKMRSNCLFFVCWHCLCAFGIVMEMSLRQMCSCVYGEMDLAIQNNTSEERTIALRAMVAASGGHFGSLTSRNVHRYVVMLPSYVIFGNFMTMLVAEYVALLLLSQVFCFRSLSRSFNNISPVVDMRLVV